MAMRWRKSPDVLIEKFSKIVPQDPRVERRKMFGYPAAFVGGNLFMGLHQEALILRLSDEDRASFLTIEGASVFEPMRGRPHARVRGRALLHGRPGDIADKLDSSLAGICRLDHTQERRTGQRQAKGSHAKTRRHEDPAPLMTRIP